MSLTRLAEESARTYGEYVSLAFEGREYTNLDLDRAAQVKLGKGVTGVRSETLVTDPTAGTRRGGRKTEQPPSAQPAPARLTSSRPVLRHPGSAYVIPATLTSSRLAQ